MMTTFARFILVLLCWGVAPFVAAEALDINTATVEQLETVLVGVGPAKAKAIVEDREKNGKFASVDDLVRVKGIGPATLEKNRDKITVGSGTALPTGEAAAQPAPAPTAAPKSPPKTP